MLEERFDYIVVGAGTAGCLLAIRLSADPAVRVLLLEAGGYRWIHIPVGYLYCIGNPRVDWLFRTIDEPGLGGGSIGYPRGKVLGGSSSINGMITMRGQRGDHDGWAADGNPGWKWDGVLPYFVRHEDHHSRDGGGSDSGARGTAANGASSAGGSAGRSSTRFATWLRRQGPCGKQAHTFRV